MDLDPLDARLLQLLRQDARRSFRELARLAGTTTPTAIARVRTLEELGVIRGYRAELDPAALGGLMLARLRARAGAVEELARAAAALDGAEEALVLGPRDVMVRLRAGSPEAARAALLALPGAERCRVEAVRGAHAGLAEVPTRLDVRCHQCHGPIHGAALRAVVAARRHVFCCAHCQATFTARAATLAQARLKR